MIRVLTDFPVALTSPDHIHPWGTIRDNNTSHQLLNELEAYFNGTYSLLDLGCAGGQFVIDAVNLGKIAVGLEGSDCSVINQRANWPYYHNKNLFVCDISKPFRIFNDESPLKFDCITSWEFLEHLFPEDLDVVCKNVLHHLKPTGIFIGQLSLIDDWGDGSAKLHNSIFPIVEWHDVFCKYFNIHDYIFSGNVRPDCASWGYKYFLTPKV